MLTKNEYGNIVLPAPADCVHIDVMRAGVTARAIGIEYAPAVTGWRHHRPVISGIVIEAVKKDLLEKALAEKNSPEAKAKKEAAAKRKQEKLIKEVIAEIKERFPGIPDLDARLIAQHGWEVGSGRVGRSTTAYDPILMATVAHIRHDYTDYDDLLNRGEDRDMARAEVADKITETLDKWSETNGNPSLPQAKL